MVNRAIADCLDFTNVRTISEVAYQSPGGFTGVDSPLFYSSPTTLEKNLADRVIRGDYFYPATNALWFYAPSTGASCKATWWNQELSGRYKSHCFYMPASGECQELH